MRQVDIRHRGRQGAGPAGRPQLSAQCNGRFGRCRWRSACAHSLIKAHRRLRLRGDRGHGGWHRSGTPGAPLRRALHDEGRGTWSWLVDLQEDHQCSWWAAMGGAKQGTRRDIQVRCPGASIDPPLGEQLSMPCPPSIHIVDDDQLVRESLGDLLRSLDYQVALYQSASEFLDAELPDAPGCLVLDVRLPGTSGLELQAHLTGLNVGLPIILMTGFGDIPMSVRGMKAGAIDFLTKPVRDQDLLDAVAAAIQVDQTRRQEIAQIDKLRERYALLTPRERQVTALVASGVMNKHIANELSISEVTVKMHRSSAMRKLDAKSVARLARIAEILNIPS